MASEEELAFAREIGAIVPGEEPTVTPTPTPVSGITPPTLSREALDFANSLGIDTTEIEPTTMETVEQGAINLGQRITELQSGITKESAQLAETMMRTEIPVVTPIARFINENIVDPIHEGGERTAEILGRAGVPPAIAATPGTIASTAVFELPETVGEAALMAAAVATFGFAGRVGAATPILKDPVGIAAGKIFKGGFRKAKRFVLKAADRFTSVKVKPTPSVTGPSLSNQLTKLESIVQEARIGGATDPVKALTPREQALFQQYVPAMRKARNTGQPLEKLVGEQAAVDLRTEMARSPLARAMDHLETITRPELIDGFKMPATAPKGPNRELTMQNRADSVTNRVRLETEYLGELNKRTQIITESAADIETTGTIPKGRRPELRTAGKPLPENELEAFQVSKKIIQETSQRLTSLFGEVQRLEQQLRGGADKLSAANATAMREALETARSLLRQHSQDWTAQRYATNRAMQAYNGPLPRSVIDALRSVGQLGEGLKSVRERPPIGDNILRLSAKMIKEKGLTGAEYQELGTEMVEGFRLNLFSWASWTLDLVGNAGAQTANAAAGLGHDFGYFTRTGEFTMPATRGLFHAIRNRSPFTVVENANGERVAQLRMPEYLRPDVEEAFGSTVSGEIIQGGLTGERGAFFNRPEFLNPKMGWIEASINFGRNIADYVIGSPLYFKGAVDQASKRLGAVNHAYQEAFKMADKFGLKGTDRKLYVEKFMQDIPPNVVEGMIETGNKLGFNRELSKIEETISSSTGVKLLFDAFPRWTFQFTRWSAETLGFNPKLWGKVVNETAKSEEIGAYLATAATGWGGIYYLSETFYDQVDFNSMEYVKEDGNRVRLSNRDPITTGLFYVAMIKGHTDRALAALKFSSIPGARFVSQEGGLLGSIAAQLMGAQKNREVSPRRMLDELTDILNRAIPGQALLSVTESIMDPTIRKGLGANIPFLSETKPPVINPSTGEPLVVKNVDPIFGINLPAAGGTIVPGAVRILSPVRKVLNEVGLMVYRGPRSPVGALPPRDMPEELLDEWLIELGKARQLFIAPIAQGGKNRAKFKNALEKDFEVARKMVMELDASAARVATNIVTKRMKDRGQGVAPPQRGLTRREKALPVVQRERIERSLDRRRGISP